MSGSLILVALLVSCVTGSMHFLATGAFSPVFPQGPSAPPSQAQSTPATSTTTPDAAKPAPKKAKRVWTNDNLGDSGGTISVVGSTQPTPKAKPKTAGDKPLDPKQIASFRQALKQMEAQLARVDKALNDLTSLSKGDAKGSGGLQQSTWNYNSSSVEEQIHDLQQKKSQIQQAIDDLLDAARKEGIEPGQLR